MATWSKLISRTDENQFILLYENKEQYEIELPFGIEVIEIKKVKQQSQHQQKQHESVAFLTNKSNNGFCINGLEVEKHEERIINTGDILSFYLLNTSAEYKLVSFTFTEFSKPFDDFVETNYLIGEPLLGSKGGCNGNVINCVSIENGKQYVAKLAYKYDEDYIEVTSNQIIKESKLLKQFENQLNIIKMVQVINTKEFYGIIMEKAMCDLSKFIKVGGWCEKEVKLIFKQACAGLSVLHSNGVVHRDIKPGNLVFMGGNCDPLSSIKFIDLGLSSLIDQKVNCYGCTYFYIAPELTKYVDKKKYEFGGHKITDSIGIETDVYSMGILLYILLSGIHPFISIGDTNHDIIYKISIGKYNFDDVVWNGISSDAKDLIVKMLSFNPNKRITINDALNHKWFTNEKSSFYLQNISVPQSIISISGDQFIQSTIIPNQIRNSSEHSVPISNLFNITTSTSVNNNNIKPSKRRNYSDFNDSGNISDYNFKNTLRLSSNNSIIKQKRPSFINNFISSSSSSSSLSYKNNNNDQSSKKQKV